MALFPEKIGGKYAMVGRQDGKNLFLLRSDRIDRWNDEGVLLMEPKYPWEFIQIGNCGSPILTDAGWLLFTHGVGAMRKYSLGCALLDLDDPSKVIGRTNEPVLTAIDADRSGYVPNVVYTCGVAEGGRAAAGALRHFRQRGGLRHRRDRRPAGPDGLAARSARMLLETKTVEKPWGKDMLPAPFETPDGKRIGEIWFEPPRRAARSCWSNTCSPARSCRSRSTRRDAQTQAAGLGKQGKEECWLVIDAEPGATLGIGFDRRSTPRRCAPPRSMAASRQMLVWHDVAPGDFFYIPANTVHAIGPGCSIIEIQQNSDITYRLYDYGRPRELHLEDSVRVAQAGPYDETNHKHVTEGVDASLVAGPYFRLDYVIGEPGEAIAAMYDGPLLVIPRLGETVIGSERVFPGQCALASALAQVSFDPDGECLIAQPIAGAR